MQTSDFPTRGPAPLRLLALMAAVGLVAVGCGQGATIVVVMPGAGAPDDAAVADAPTTPSPEASTGTDSGPAADGSLAADAGDGASGTQGNTQADAAGGLPGVDAALPRGDAGDPRLDGGILDAYVVDAAPRPDPGGYGCAEAPFNPDGTVCLVHDPCVPGDSASYRASASLQCMYDGNAEELTCASSSPYLSHGPSFVPASTLLRLGNFQVFPVRLRTPEVTNGARACPVECAGVPTAATGVMRFQLALPFRERVTVKVGAPWKVAVDLANPFCVPPTTAGVAGCAALDVQTATITVFTTDYYAPSRDVVIDGTARMTCP